MNVARAVEIAVAGVLRQFAQLGAGVTVRAWQSLPTDGSWTKESDRRFPLVDVRCSPPKTDENERTFYVECSVLCATKVDDDRNHAFVSEMYGEVQRVLDAMFSQYWNTAGDELNAFNAALTGELGTNFNGAQGLTWGDGVAPYLEQGANVIGVAVRVHYSRKDY